MRNFGYGRFVALYVRGIRREDDESNTCRNGETSLIHEETKL
jgi:hypothetical protein